MGVVYAFLDARIVSVSAYCIPFVLYVSRTELLASLNRVEVVEMSAALSDFVVEFLTDMSIKYVPVFGKNRTKTVLIGQMFVVEVSAAKSAYTL